MNKFKTALLTAFFLFLLGINYSLAGFVIPMSDCCEANGTPGCDDPTCEATVCGVDPFCCNFFWDSICMGHAFDLCPELMCMLPPPIIGFDPECLNATGPLAVPSDTAGTTIGQPSTPISDGCGTPVTAPGVTWYTVIGTGNTMTASTCNQADYDTKISIYCDVCQELNCVAGRDDNFGAGCADYTTLLEWPSIAGVEYKILVHGFSSETGNFTLSIFDDGVPVENQASCDDIVVAPELESDTDPYQLYSYFDLRERESFIQITNTESSDVTVHVQIFDAGNSCIENNFFDTYTPNDTHVYNMRDILTNNGNPSGVSLPDGAYGFVVVTAVGGVSGPSDPDVSLVGNFRILDNAGYEYRTNSLGINFDIPVLINQFTFNYNIRGDVTLSDVVGINVNQNSPQGEVIADPISANTVFDVDIFNLDEVPFSCRDIAFACVNENDLLLEQVLENKGISVARFEYGINEAIPHSRGGEVLCSGNNISEGFVVLNPENTTSDVFAGYVGLNSGNGRGSMDSFWTENDLVNNLTSTSTLQFFSAPSR